MSLGPGIIGLLFIALAMLWSPVAVLAVLLIGFLGLALIELIGVGGCRFFGRSR